MRECGGPHRKWVVARPRRNLWPVPPRPAHTVTKSYSNFCESYSYPGSVGGTVRQGRVQGPCQKMAFIFLSLEGLWIYNCVVFTTNRVAVSWLGEDSITGR